jgi:hypothetical protein
LITKAGYQVQSASYANMTAAAGVAIQANKFAEAESFVAEGFASLRRAAVARRSEPDATAGRIVYAGAISLNRCYPVGRGL